MRIMTAGDLLGLGPGQSVSKRVLFDLIQYSKQEGSAHWSGPGGRIGNTPQQGINWIGLPPDVTGVIIKTRPGSYEHDGWADEAHGLYRYSFKARKGVVDHGELANRVLIDQPLGLYPVLLFTESGTEWRFEGRFDVSEIAGDHVVLRRQSGASEQTPEAVDMVWREGRRRYVTHLLAERSRALVAWIKSVTEPACDICEENPSDRYGVPVIDAHHRKPVTAWTDEHEVTPDDIALVCPNCHRAVHACMRQGEDSYEAIRDQLRLRLVVSD